MTLPRNGKRRGRMISSAPAARNHGPPGWSSAGCSRRVLGTVMLSGANEIAHRVLTLLFLPLGEDDRQSLQVLLRRVLQARHGRDTFRASFASAGVDSAGSALRQG